MLIIININLIYINKYDYYNNSREHLFKILILLIFEFITCLKFFEKNKIYN